MFNKIWEYIIKNKVLVVAAIILLIIKLFNLDQIYLLRGERDIVFTGYSLARTAKDIYGHFLPLEFKNLDMPTPFLAFYFSALWSLILPLKSVFFARLPYVLLSLSLLFLVYEILMIVTKDKKIAILTAIVFSFSPGVFHLTRLSLEIGLAMPLLLAGMIAYLKEKRSWSYIFFALCFFTYNGFRPLIPFMLIYLEGYFLLLRKKPKEFLVQNCKNILFFILLLVVSFTVVDGHMMMSRQKDLVFLSYDKINPMVIYRRNTAIGPNILKAIFNNKITSTIYYMIDVFIRGQDLQYLFLKGDDAAIYATTFTGQFFLMTMLFYYGGLFFLGRKWNGRYFYVLGLIPVALIPSLVNIDYISVAIRSMPASIGYAFIIGCGLYLGWSLLGKVPKIMKKAAIVIFALGILIELSYFGYNYYLRRPITMSEQFFESEKQLAEYMVVHQNNYTIYHNSPRSIYVSYLFLKQTFDMKTAQNNFAKGYPYEFDGFTLRDCNRDAKGNIVPVTTAKKMIISYPCTDKKLYDRLENDPSVKKIPYTDFSFKTAFFIID